MKLQHEIVERWEGLTPLKAPSSYLRRHARAAAANDLEAEGKRESFLAADGQSPTPLEREALLGNNDLLDVNFLERCSLACQAIGRIDAKSPDGRVRATGFLISTGLLITNHHVLPDADVAATGTVEFGYRYNIAGELGQTTRFELDPASFYVADEKLDYAVVAVKAASFTGRESIADFGYLRMHPDRGKVREREFVTIIQHPDGQPLQIALRENQVTRLDSASTFVQYEADTAHGSSGAPVFNDSLQIAALHSSGRIKRNAAGEYVLRGDGGTTTSLEGLSETDVVWEANVGYRVSFICADLMQRAQAERPSFVPLLQQAMAGGDILARAVVAARTSPTGHVTPVKPQTNDETEKITMRPESETTDTADFNAEARADLRGRGLTIPLTLRVMLEDPRAAAQPAEAPAGRGLGASREEALFAAEAAKMRVPVIYDGLEDREGFDPDFLELGGGKIEIPALTAKGEKVAAPLLDGDGFELRYHKFSVIMHKERRLAILTASNVDWRADRRLINGQKPSREQLTEIPKGYAEQWVTDERIAAAHQLPDVFFTEDRQSFDKGHLVRRDDVCWGADFEDMQMANGDTYHVTNCSPQLKSFNQAPHGDFNWGDFENEVQKRTKAEKVIIFAGPVLDPKDRWFRGVDENGPVRVRTPSRFWKIVVSKGNDGPEAYGFIFKQDVTEITEKEFVVSPEWRHATIAVSTIAKLLRGWVDLSQLAAIDQFQAG